MRRKTPLALNWNAEKFILICVNSYVKLTCFGNITYMFEMIPTKFFDCFAYKKSRQQLQNLFRGLIYFYKVAISHNYLKLLGHNTQRHSSTSNNHINLLDIEPFKRIRMYLTIEIKFMFLLINIICTCNGNKFDYHASWDGH